MKKLLLVEDDKIVGTIYACKFRLERFEVELATDGNQGLAAVEWFKPDLIILDLMLPRTNGLEILKQLRSRSETKALPIIVFTNTFLNRLAKDAAAAGATRCLSKAETSPSQLLSVVREVMAEMEKPSPGVHPTRPPTAPEPSPNAAGASADGLDVQKALLESTVALRGLAQRLQGASNTSAHQSVLTELYDKIHTLASQAAVGEAPLISRICTAFEALLSELQSKPKFISASTIRTTAQTVEFLGDLIKQRASGPIATLESPNILVVDDDVLSRRNITHALNKALLASVNVEDPFEACRLLETKRYDLIITDVNMPGMTGFELCQRLRAMPEQRATPVVFVTSLDDFESRKTAALSGGDDFIVKPFLSVELSVKALTHLLRPGLKGADAKGKPFQPLV